MKSFQNLQLHSQRLILRPLEMKDIDAIFAIFSDQETMKYWSSLPWSNVNQSKEMIRKDQKEMASGGYLRLGLELISSGKLIGTCQLFSFDKQNKRAEIGYILGKHHWRQGFMTEALKSLINYGFNELQLHRVEADIDPENTASAGILTKLGFVKEGHLKERWLVGDKFLDSYLFGLLRKDWKV